MLKTPSFTESLQKFNKQQLKAITGDLFPTIVIAGAGTGKTSTLIHRILYLIFEKKIDPKKILVLTFTNKAILEIKERISKFDIAELPQIFTCHTFCAQQLRQHSHLLDRESSYNIINQSASSKIWNRLLKDVLGKDAEDDSYDLETVDVRKKIRLTGDAVKKILDKVARADKKSKANEIFEGEMWRFTTKITYAQALAIKAEYENEKKDSNSFDFDDLLHHFNKLLKDADTRAAFNEKFDAILVDEFQDIDNIQFDIIKQLTQKNQHIFVVGDPDQSIYAFRGAVTGIFDIFEQHYSANKVNIVKLEENYRSSKEILRVANASINIQTNKYEKHLYTNNQQGEKVSYSFTPKVMDGVNWVIKEIKSLVTNEGYSLNDIAILYRTNYSSLGIEKHLVMGNLPYVIGKTKNFFDKVEIKLILNYLNVIFLDDAIACESIINTPIRKIGPAFIKKIKAFSRDNGLNFYQGVKECCRQQAFSETYFQKLRPFLTLLEEFEEIKQLTNIKDIITTLLQKVDIVEFCKLTDDKKKQDFENNVNLLINHLTERLKEYSDIKELLINLSLENEIDIGERKNERVTLSTIHQAKGLEFKCVFILYLNNCMIPYKRPCSTKEELEEERRIFYVALTRAKERLYLLACSPENLPIIPNRKDYQSVYIQELESLLDINDVTPAFGRFKVW